MCQSCNDGVSTDVHIVSPTLEPEKAAEFKRRGGRYVLDDDFFGGNARDARENAKARQGWSIPSEAWERIFGRRQ